MELPHRGSCLGPAKPASQASDLSRVTKDTRRHCLSKARYSPLMQASIPPSFTLSGVEEGLDKGEREDTVSVFSSAQGKLENRENPDALTCDTPLLFAPCSSAISIQDLPDPSSTTAVSICPTLFTASLTQRTSDYLYSSGRNTKESSNKWGT